LNRGVPGLRVAPTPPPPSRLQCCQNPPPKSQASQQ
jgi:hypothetical protein